MKVTSKWEIRAKARRAHPAPEHFVRFQSLRSRDLDDQLIEELWHFRSRFMGLRTDVSVEEDLAAFRDHIRSFDKTWISRDKAGTIVCCIAACSGRLQIFDKTLRYINADYAFSVRGLQRVPWPFLCCRVYVLRHYLLRPFSRWFIAGPTYPYSYLVFRLGACVCHTLSQASHLPAFEREAILAFARTICGESYDYSSGLVRMRTIPRFDLPRHRLNPEQKDLMRSYLQENPNWREGYTVFAMLPVDSAFVLRRCFGRLWRVVTKAWQGRPLRKADA